MVWLSARRPSAPILFCVLPHQKTINPAFKTTISSASTRPRTIGGRVFESIPKERAADSMRIRAISVIRPVFCRKPFLSSTDETKIHNIAAKVRSLR
jgi:hypothetical protein